MSLNVSCTSCGKLYQNLKMELRGKRVRCKCGSKMVVPDESTNALLSQPSPEAQPIPAQPSYLPSTAPKSRRVKRRKSETSDFRPIDFLYMFGGGIVFTSGIHSIIGLLGSLLGLPRLLALFQNAPGGLSDHMPRFVGLLALGLVESLMSVLLGFFAGAMGYYVYQKRLQGKSEYSWAFGYSAIVAVASLLVSFLGAVIWMVGMYSISREAAFPIVFGYASLFLAPLPIFVLVLYGMRRQLGFKELGSK